MLRIKATKMRPFTLRSMSLCRGGQGEPPEPDLTKREKWATRRRCQARAIFAGGASINLDLDLVVIWLSSASELTGPSVRGYLPYSRAVFTSIQSCVTQAFSHHSQHILASKQGDSGSSVYLQLSWTCALRAPSDYSVSLLVVGFLPQAPTVVAPFLSIKIFRLEWLNVVIGGGG